MQSRTGHAAVAFVVGDRFRLGSSADVQGVRGFGGLNLGFGPTLHAYEVGGDLEGPETYGGHLFGLHDSYHCWTGVFSISASYLFL